MLCNHLPTPRNGLIVSGIAHAVLVLSLLIAWPHLVGSSDGDVPIIPVELVTVGDETNVAPMTRERLPYPEADQARAPAAMPTPAEAAPTFEMKLFPTKPPPPRAADAPAKNATLDGQGRSASPTSAPTDARAGDYDIKGVGEQTASTLSVLDALRNQIARCWIRSASPVQANVVVAFELFLNRDGSIARPPTLKQGLDGESAENSRGQAEAIRRAIYTCAPYQLPAAKYDIWQHSVVVFDLKKLGP